MLSNYISKDLINQIEDEYSIKITYCTEDVHGKVKDKAYSGGNEIFLGKYSSLKLEILCLFHELGHILSRRKKSNEFFICTLSEEAVAWEICIELINKHKDWFDCEFDLNNYYGEELKFMRKCLKSYFDSEYNELRV